jgi:hypothetical protein
MGTLYGIVFFSHQLGSFLGVWLGGRLYDIYGDYTAGLVGRRRGGRVLGHRAPARYGRWWWRSCPRRPARGAARCRRPRACRGGRRRSGPDAGPGAASRRASPGRWRHGGGQMMSASPTAVPDHPRPRCPVFRRQRRRLVGCGSRRRNRASGKPAPIGLDQRRPDGARAHDQDALAVGPGQPQRGDSRLSPAVFHLVTRWKSTAPPACRRGRRTARPAVHRRQAAARGCRERRSRS